MVFVFCTKFGSNICYSHWDRPTYASELHMITSRELTSGYDFWSCGHLCMAVCIFPWNLVQISLSNPQLLKFKIAAAAILDFQFKWMWPFRRVDSVVFVFCAKFGSNICYSHWDRRTYTSDIYLTSRELTSGFDVWSRGHLRMAMAHIPI